MTPGISKTLLQAALVRAVFAGLGWIILTGGSTYNWGFALLVIAAAVVTSLYMMPAGSWHWTLTGMVRFLPFFMKQSIVGGIDVSLRAFHPKMPLQPGIVTYRFRMPDGPQRVFFTNSVSLQPGSFVVSIDGDTLEIHALDTRMPIVDNLSSLEERVAALFGVDIPA